MADNTKSKIHYDDFIANVQPDPAKPESTIMLSGFIGRGVDDRSMEQTQLERAQVRGDDILDIGAAVEQLVRLRVGVVVALAQLSDGGQSVAKDVRHWQPACGCG